jgi:serine/threonine-protein kinase
MMVRADRVAVADQLSVLKVALTGRYTVERELGRGGMATVYLAQDVKHRRPVAIKVLRAELAAALGADRFLREIEIAARLQHPHILPLYDSGTADGQLFYVMPYVEGESLRDRLQRDKQLALDEAVRITGEAASALLYAHSHGVVHRDIKPENILLSGGTAVVADFGIARAISAAADSEQLTQTGMVVGTPAYMSPEQGAAGSEIDGRSDQYSLACVLYEMLVGQPPFTGPNSQAILARHSFDSVSPPSIVRHTVPDTVERAILRALAKVPADRYPTMALFAEALTKPGTATGTRRVAPGGPPSLRQPAGRTALVVGAAVLVLAGAAWAVLARRHGGAAGAAGLDLRRLAVLYFDDLSRDHSLGYLSDGITEALIADLSRVQPLVVISRNGVGPYRGEAVAPERIAQTLAVGSLVQGTVEQLGDRFHVSVRLVDGMSGVDFMRASFDQPVGGLLGLIRDSLATRVAEFLRQRLGEQVRLRGTRLGTTSVAAWSLGERAERIRKDAEAALRHGGAQGTATAMTAFQQADSVAALAEAADERWVEPIVFRGQLAYRRSRLAETPREAVSWIELGLSHAGRALRLAPNDATALELRGTLRYFRWTLRLTPDPAAAQALLGSARQDLEAAVQADPSLASAHSTLSHLYYQYDDVAAAVLAARRAYEADAYLSVATEILSRLFLGSLDLEQFSQAERWCNELTRRFARDYRSADCRLTLMTTPAFAPDVRQAWQLVAAIDSLTPAARRPFVGSKARLMAGGVIARSGLADSARQVLDRAHAALTPAVDPGQELLGVEAYQRILLGDRDQAIALVQRYAAANPGHFERGKDIGWWYRDLRNDPRFKALIGAH